MPNTLPSNPPRPPSPRLANLNTGKTTRLPARRTSATTDAIESAVVYCESHFAGIDGKTANGLVRHSEKYNVVAVIDSKQAGLDAGAVLDGQPNDIPICYDLADAIAKVGSVPDHFIIGIAPASGTLTRSERDRVLEAMNHGMNVVNGLHEFLGDDPEFSAASSVNNVRILDVRKPRNKKELRQFSGRIAEVSCPRIAVLGTDSAIGKRTTATVISRALNDYGLKTVLVNTGQTGIMQGSRYGVALDAVPSQFCAGELEAVIVEAFEAERPDVILIEGQGALSHPAYSTSSFILRGGCPNAVVLQHAPARKTRCDFAQMEMPTPASEVHLIEAFADTKVIGLTINHERLSDEEIDAAIASYEDELGIPATDALARPPQHLVEMVLAAFPQLREKPIVSVR